MPFIYHARIKKGSGPPNLKNSNFLYLHSKIHSNITENMPRNLTLHPPFQANLNIYSIPPGKKKFWIPAWFTLPLPPQKNQASFSLIMLSHLPRNLIYTFRHINCVTWTKMCKVHVLQRRYIGGGVSMDTVW